MADRVQVAIRTSAATQRLLRAVEHLQQGKPEDQRIQVGGVSKDPAVKQAELLESVAAFLEGEAGIEMPVYAPIQGTVTPPEQPKPAVPPKSETFKPTQAKPAKPEPKDADDETGEGGEGEEPLFHGKPLAHYDDMSDQEIIDIKGIGPKTLDEIKAARKARERKAQR